MNTKDQCREVLSTIPPPAHNIFHIASMGARKDTSLISFMSLWTCYSYMMPTSFHLSPQSWLTPSHSCLWTRCVTVQSVWVFTVNLRLFKTCLVVLWAFSSQQRRALKTSCGFNGVFQWTCQAFHISRRSVETAHHFTGKKIYFNLSRCAAAAPDPKKGKWSVVDSGLW